MQRTNWSCYFHNIYERTGLTILTVIKIMSSIVHVMTTWSAGCEYHFTENFKTSNAYLSLSEMFHYEIEEASSHNPGAFRAHIGCNSITVLEILCDNGFKLVSTHGHFGNPCLHSYILVANPVIAWFLLQNNFAFHKKHYQWQELKMTEWLITARI